VRVSTLSYEGGRWTGDETLKGAQLVLWFAEPAVAADASVFAQLKDLYPGAQIVGGSAAGEFLGGEASSGGGVAAAIRFARVRTRAVEAPIDPVADPTARGRALIGQLLGEDLRAIFLLPATIQHRDGYLPAHLVRGAAQALPADVPLFGGGAGDISSREAAPRAGLDRPPGVDTMVAVGFYGEALRVGCGVAGGWDPLGPVRRVTRAELNVVYELDGQPALDIYLRYAGIEADQFDGAASRYPFLIRSDEAGEDYLRAVTSFKTAERALVFSDIVPEGGFAQIGHGTFDALVDAGAAAAREAVRRCGVDRGLAFFATCVVRKSILGQRIFDEAEAVAEELGAIPSIGFVSFGELGPHPRTGRAFCHALSVSVAVLGEAADVD
jgi:hypothetical protein